MLEDLSPGQSSDGPVTLQDYSFSNWGTLLMDLHSKLHDNSLADVILRTSVPPEQGQNEEDQMTRSMTRDIPAHRILLALRVPFFNTRFTTPLGQTSGDTTITNTNTTKANTTNTTTIVDLTNFSYDAVSDIVEFVYVGRVTIRSLGRLCDVILLADYLNILTLKTRAEGALIRHFLSLDSCLEVSRWVSTYRAILSEDTVTSVLNVLCRCWSAVTGGRSSLVSRDAPSREWTRLPYLFLQGIVSSDRLNIRSEDEILEDVITWMEANPQYQDNLYDIVSKLRVRALSTRAVNRATTHPIFTSRSRSVAVLLDARAEVQFPEEVRSSEKVTQLDQRDRLYRQSTLWTFVPFKVSGTYKPSNDGNSQTIAVAMATQTGMFRTVRIPCDFHWNDLKPVVVGDSVYVIGGPQYSRNFDKSGLEQITMHTGQVIHLDLRTMETRVLKDRLPAGVSLHSSGVLPGRQGWLYTCGGLTSVKSESSKGLWLRDPVEAKWTFGGAPMLQPRYHHTSQSYDEKIYVMGGFKLPRDLDMPADTCEIWDGGCDTWVTSAPLNEKRIAPTSMRVGPRIYVAGGIKTISAAKSWESIDPRSDTTWTKMDFPKCLCDKKLSFVGVGDHEVHVVDIPGGVIHVFDTRNEGWHPTHAIPSEIYEVLDTCSDFGDFGNSTVELFGGSKFDFKRFSKDSLHTESGVSSVYVT